MVRSSTGKALSCHPLQDRKQTEGQVEKEGRRKKEEGRIWHQVIRAAATSQVPSTGGRWTDGVRPHTTKFTKKGKGIPK